MVAIDMIDHIKGDWEITEQPSCNKTGTKVKKCTSCGKVMESESIAMTKHTLSDVVTPPTPTSQGYTTHTCTVCGYSYVDSYTDYEAPHVHDFSGKEELIEAATCTKDGSKKVYCTGDGCDEYTIVTLPKIAHTAGEWEIIEPATCSKCGTKAKKCIGCGKVMETADVEMLKHSYVDTVTLPTPTTQGYTTHKCSACGYQYIDSYTDYVEERVVSLSASKVRSSAGKTIQMDITIQNNIGFGGMAFDIIYDNNILELVSCELSIGGSICTNSGIDTYPNKINFQYAGIENVTGDGVLASLTFKIKDTAQAGNSTVRIVPEEGTFFYYADKVEADFTVDCFDGVVEVVEHTPGDTNGDGKINNRDAARILQYLAGWDVECNLAALDINGDGKINNRDAARLLQYLAGWNVEIY